MRILDDELLSTNKATLPISNNEAARLLLNMKSNKMNNNEEVIKQQEHYLECLNPEELEHLGLGLIVVV